MDLESLSTRYGLPALFVGLLLAGLGLPIPEDVFMITGGGLTVVKVEHGADRWTSILVAIAVLYAGVMAGDSIVYALGHRFGDGLFARRPFRRFMTPERVARVRGYYAKYGAATVFIARHTAPVRFVTFLMAGVSRMPFSKFFFWDSLAAILSVPLWFALGYFFWDRRHELKHQIESNLLLATGIAAAALGIWWWRRVAKRRKAARAAAAPAPATEP